LTILLQNPNSLRSKEADKKVNNFVIFGNFVAEDVQVTSSERLGDNDE